MDSSKQPPATEPADGDLIYARFSSDNQRPTSITDQVQSIQAYAERAYGCRPESVIADHAESVKAGTAPNWEAVLNLVRTGRVRRVFVDESSRITRELQALLQVQAVFRHYEVALICAHERLDLTDERADLNLIFSGYKNQAASRDSSHRIRRSMDGNVRRNLSNGDLCYGYTSVPLTDGEVAEAGLPARKPGDRPYKKLVIVEAEAKIVKDIHRWFAVEKQSIGAIVRHLNEHRVPRGGKARTATWKPIDIRKILERRRYLGYRIRNETMVVRNPETGKREVRRQDPSRRIETLLPELAILTVEEFDRSARRLEELADVYGRGVRGWRRGAKPAADYAPRNLLAGVLVCGACGHTLTQTSGHQGGYYGCPQAPLGLCENRVTANRELAEARIIEAIAAELDFPVVAPTLLQLVQHEVERLRAGRPNQVRDLREGIETLEREIERLVLAVAGGGSESLGDAIRSRDHQKAVLQRELEVAEQRAHTEFEPPTLAWVEEQLSRRFPELLRSEPRRASLLLRELTGPIEVHPETKSWLRRPHLVARCTVDLAAGLDTADAGYPATVGFGTTIEVPLRNVPFYEEYAGRVLELHNKGLTMPQIAAELAMDVSPAAVKTALNFARFGTPDPGSRAWKGHCRRRQLGSV